MRRHDRQAFTELYRLYQPRLLAYLNRMLASMAFADEIVDDVMFVVWKDASKFRGASAVSSWIFGIAYRQAMSALRSEKRFQRPLDRNADVGELVAPPARDLDLLGAGLAELSPDHRQVIVLSISAAAPTRRSPRSPTVRSAPSRPACSMRGGG